MHWVLLLYIYTGAMGTNNEVTLTNVNGFSSQEQCIDAGKKAGDLVSYTFKDLRYVCIPQQ